MAMVGGLDLHRRQITFDVVELEFQSIEQLWDVVAWVSLVREANQAR